MFGLFLGEFSGFLGLFFGDGLLFSVTSWDLVRNILFFLSLERMGAVMVRKFCPVKQVVTIEAISVSFYGRGWVKRGGIRDKCFVFNDDHVVTADGSALLFDGRDEDRGQAFA